MTYLFNNRKLEKIVRIWELKQEMEAKLKAVRQWYDTWGPLYETLLDKDGRPHHKPKTLNIRQSNNNLNVSKMSINTDKWGPKKTVIKEDDEENNKELEAADP